jgi:hypothetical protein
LDLSAVADSSVVKKSVAAIWSACADERPSLTWRQFASGLEQGAQRVDRQIGHRRSTAFSAVCRPGLLSLDRGSDWESASLR